MADENHIAQLTRGGAAWNTWRHENPDIRPDLNGAKLTNADLRGAFLSEASLLGTDLRGANLTGADLTNAKLRGACLKRANLTGAHLTYADLKRALLTRVNLSLVDLTGADLTGADLTGASLSGATFSEANFSRANLRNADLSQVNSKARVFREALRLMNFSDVDLIKGKVPRGLENFINAGHLSVADFSKADLSGANLSTACLVGANLRGANLQGAALVDTDLTDADLTGCCIYGVSAWGLRLEGTKQQNLVITRADEPEITVDNIEVAQFIYLLLHNQKVRQIIDTITSKVVLILGRFTLQRKAVLDALREELRRRNYLPILFDFDKPANRDITETISLLARMARFVLADITDARSIPQELNVIVPDLPSVPVQPLLLKESSQYGMFEHYTRYPWVLPLYLYETQDQLITVLGEVVEAAERMALELQAGTKQRTT